MSAAELTWASVLAWRVERQQLAERAPAKRALDVVGRIAGLHAQVLSSAELALSVRVDGLDPEWVSGALWEDRTLVKTWAMRGTLHLLRADELPRYVAALSRLRPRHHVPSWLRHHGLERKEADAMLAAIPRALAGSQLTREELAAAVAEATGNPQLATKLGGGFGDLLKPAAFTGDLCFAPGEGQRVRFALPRDWLGEQAAEDPEAAGRALVRTYLAAYGPAPREQFQRWFGMTSPAEAGRWLTALGDEVVEVDVEGQRGWLLAADLDAVAASAPAGIVRLLPAFDPYVVAAPRGTDAVVPAAERARVYRPQGWLSPVVLVDGRIAGVWSHEDGAVTVEPFSRPRKDLRAGVEAEAERLARWFGTEPALRWS